MFDGPTATACAALVGAGVALTNAYRQDQRARFTQMLTILAQQDTRFEGEEFRKTRRAAATWIMAGSSTQDEEGEQSAKDVLNFFETLAFLHRREAVDAEAVWHYFASWLLPYHDALDALRTREQREDPNCFREFPDLYSAVFQIEREKRDYKGTEKVVSAEAIHAFLMGEATLPTA